MDFVMCQKVSICPTVRRAPQWSRDIVSLFVKSYVFLWLRPLCMGDGAPDVVVVLASASTADGGAAFQSIVGQVSCDAHERI